MLNKNITLRDGILLATLSAAQLLVVLDITIVNTAIPSAQAELGMNDALRQWIITGYALAFGSVLLIGGRVADYWGCKRTFILGLGIFGGRVRMVAK